jgi:hypothetical protein
MWHQVEMAIASITVINKHFPSKHKVKMCLSLLKYLKDFFCLKCICLCQTQYNKKWNEMFLQKFHQYNFFV